MQHRDVRGGSGYPAVQTTVLPQLDAMPTVLLIDDDPTLLDALTLAFEDAGYRVELAHDGREGLQRVVDRMPDAVVSDVNMPGLDGFFAVPQAARGGQRRSRAAADRPQSRDR